MASKGFLHSLIFQCFLFTVVFPLIHGCPQPSPDQTTAPRHVSANSSVALSSWHQLFVGFKPRPDSHGVVIQVDNIKKALWDSGFKIMSLILERNLGSLIPYADSGYGGRGGDTDTYKKNNNTIILYNGSKITIFAPWDQAISFKADSWTNYKFHIVPMKVEREDLSECSIMPSFYPHGQYLLVTSANKEEHWIHNVRVTHWNIYNDNNVIVHGVAGNFAPFLTVELFFAFCARKLARPLSQRVCN